MKIETTGNDIVINFDGKNDLEKIEELLHSIAMINLTLFDTLFKASKKTKDDKETFIKHYFDASCKATIEHYKSEEKENES